MYKSIFVFLLFLIPVFLSGQANRKDSLWLILRPFVGEWTGEGSGVPGKGRYERSYQFALNKNFIEIKNKSTYPPTDKNPKGEVHEDVGFFSYDRSLKKFKLRQFHIEGFVNEFTLDSISADNKTLVFRSYAIENIPAGWQAKEKYRIINQDELEEVFELAAPAKEFEVYTKVNLIRQK